MKYEVICLFAIGRTRKFRKGDIVNGSDFQDPALKVKQGFLKEVSDDEDVTPPAPPPPAGEEARLADIGSEPMIEPVKPEAIVVLELEPVKASITEVGPTEPDFKINPAPAKGKSKKELTDL